MSFHLLLRIFFVTLLLWAGGARAESLKIVALGDSLTAGFGLQRHEGFVPQLQKALSERGHDVVIINAGVSGDTTSGGRARLDWSIGQDTNAVILELGANDMLRALPPAIVSTNLDAMLTSLKNRNIPVLLAGMQAAPNLGPAYGREFNAIYPTLSAKHDVLLYPFFLEGVAGQQSLNQADGIHPTAEGIAVIVRNILPMVERLIERTKAAR